MINSNGNGVTKEFIDYALPLIQGENKNIFHKGIQTFAKFK
jgi:6-phosphofructokinase 1